MENKELYVYIIENPSKYRIYKPTIKQVPDVNIAEEIWILYKCNIKYIGKIKVFKAVDDPNLFKWNWKFISKGA